ncbi:alpha/beta fold hydrolase [Actinokineospora iranica]|uniref:Lysophospholipase, alpha-beta hydrolase superfamily n=1 Tax=Actinokineospora iranica TaxID=1271860 RepID=A0A1G6JDT7_9PSEU|nr:alpha/beta fold hydrolase [Actinokineospora iranica]SDC16938.1 Lysophospholipase, alpha-beta hydrolase superfamily [Actinokineospora iranica]
MADDVDRGPVLVLLHGLAGTSGVWAGLIAELAERWPGTPVAPDLPGHGRSAPLDRYSFGGIAARVAADLDPTRPAVVLGHSLGGVVALALASGWFGVPVTAAVCLGVKVSWSPDDLAKAAALAGKPPKTFENRENAASWARKLAGLPADFADSVTLGPSGWRAALDPRAFAVGRPDLPGLLAAARCPVTLAAGERDPMSPAEHLRALTPHPVILPGLGHNAHVEDPAALWPLLERVL